MAPAPTYHEKELLARIAGGDEAAFTELFNTYHPKIYQTGMMLTRSHEAAEELVQDVFLKIWLKRQQLSQVDNIESYLFIVARNHAYLTLKRHARIQLSVQQISDDSTIYDSDTEDRIMDSHYRILLEQAIERLPERQQQVYRLSKQQGLKREEVAAELQIQPNTVKEHLSKAIKNIRAYLQANADYLPPGALLVLSIWLGLPPR